LTSNCGLVVCATLESSDQGTAARTLRTTRNWRQTPCDRSGSDGFAQRSEPVALVTALRFVGYGHLDENGPAQTANFPDDFHGIVRPNGAYEIAQGRAQRHPGYTGDLGAPPPQFAKALKGRNITHGFTRRRFRPFRAWVVSGTPIPGRRFALPWAISFCPFGAAGSMVDRAITNAKRPTRSVVRSAVHGLPII
jgi:hypothetical protein